ncbi:MAG: hypothetical protein DRG59_00825 [Deltaproteobacteria bacterium]|nr:MAG: hypothetical protein DRG83_02035 [Deltaproteobacteria bacterium]RLB09971.1 MAG: hypothetical protein DRG59_00825 [Deltaproteobacteria bacterium]
MKMAKNIILGIGNLLMKDDGIGIHIVNRLNEIDLPKGIEAIDGATFTLDLLPIFQEAEKILIVDAVKGGGPPGSIYYLTPQNLKDEKSRILSLHQIGFLDVIETAKELGYCADIRILGVEPHDISWGMELSDTLDKKFDDILDAVLHYMDKFLLNNSKELS